ncbi:MAG: hypothetical protein M9962_09040, partial [Oligoflexia bacterium]|nr:hypothetical protein [Oligoflexia bacterium]
LLVLDGTTTDTPYGIAVYDSDNILVSVDGTDRIVKVNLTRGSGSDSIFYMNTALLTGNLRNITRLTSGDILIVETSNIERFTAAGLRVTTGAWPKALQTVGTGLERIPSGGFVHCSTTTDVVRTYSDDGTQIATQASGIAGTTDVIDCAAAPDGRIAAAFSGTTDTIRIYTSSTLASVSCNFSDVGLVGAPAAIAFRPNGNLLITDSTNNTFTEIDTSCTLVQSFSSPFLATPTSLRVMP